MFTGSMMINGALAVPSWTTLESGDWLGDTASFTLGSGTLTANAVDKNVRTALTVVSASQDFDFEITGGAFGTNNGPYMGFYDNGTTAGTTKPTETDDIVTIENGGATPGYEHNGDTTDTGGGKSAGFMASVVVRLSRRGSTFYAYLDDVLDHTYADVTGTAAGGFYVGCGGGGSGFSFSTMRYRLGPGLP